MDISLGLRPKRYAQSAIFAPNSVPNAFRAYLYAPVLKVARIGLYAQVKVLWIYQSIGQSVIFSRMIDRLILVKLILVK